ncbi:histone deacetylase HDT2-like [Camellia sinensis]|uniref:histone deacetylase HDT2-like n=1 Tax=Camellia sinensis TaxID=4442 RepID=UPI00103685CC|nr:histone deacetylase HDT2-like [Camellia sinensis]
MAHVVEAEPDEEEEEEEATDRQSETSAEEEGSGLGPGSGDDAEGNPEDDGSDPDDDDGAEAPNFLKLPTGTKILTPEELKGKCTEQDPRTNIRKGEFKVSSQRKRKLWGLYTNPFPEIGKATTNVGNTRFPKPILEGIEGG